MTPVTVSQGDGPVILAFPHVGTHVPDAIFAALNDAGRALADTDWHVDRLYAGLLPGATTVVATFHRYVIDGNRDPSGQTLYPGQNTTGLVPLTDFTGAPIWREGAEPGAAEIERRRLAFHAPYHAALAAEIERIMARHGLAVLYDCHSIRSRIPYLFADELPDFNIGTNDGRACAADIQRLSNEVCASAYGYTSVVNGRFKGGWTTRHYGHPATGVHAIQMELTQKTHLAEEAAPFAYDEAKAEKLRVHLKTVLERIEHWALEGGK